MDTASCFRGTIRLLPNMPPAEGFPVLLREVASQLLYTIKRRTFVTRPLHPYTSRKPKPPLSWFAKPFGLEAKTSFADCQLYYGDSRLLSESLAVVHRIAPVILGAIS